MSFDSFAWLRAPHWAVFAGAAALLAVNTASAQECEEDSDCGDGYVCKSGGQVPCAGTPQPDCAPGEKCPEITPPDCPMEEYKYCAQASCEEDSDCPSDMACVEYTSGGCTSAGSAPPQSCKDGEECPEVDPAPAPPPEPECMVATVSECTPRYRLPCEHDADCGELFKCKEQIATTCSSSGSAGGGSTPSDDGAGGKAGTPTPEDAGMAEEQPMPVDSCTSESTGEFMCELEVTACETADDCPADFECADNPNRAVCMSAGTAQRPPSADAGVDPDDSTPADGAGNAGAGGSTDDDSCGGVNDGLPKAVCLPRGFYMYGGRGDFSGAADATTSKGESTDPQASGTPPSDDDGKGGTSMTSSANNTHEAAKPDADEMDAKASDDGCAVAAPGSTSDEGHGLGLLGVLGISALLMRRRARRAA